MLRAFETVCQSAPTVAAEPGSGMLEKVGRHSNPWHWHDCMMLVLPTAGAMLLRDEDRPRGTWITEGRFAIVPAGRGHETEAVCEEHARLEFYSTDFALKRMDAETGMLTGLLRPQKLSSVFSTTPEISLLAKLFHADLPSIARSHLAAALLFACLGRAATSDALALGSANSHGVALALEIGAFVSANAAQEIPLDRLSVMFGVSRRHVTRLFREQFDCSIGAFQRAQRIDLATRLLRETDLCVTEIAFRVGFESGAALSWALRRQHGCSPITYRLAMARLVES